MNNSTARLRTSLFLLIIGMLIYGPAAMAQGGISINATGVENDPSAILDVNSTTSGLLTPRMTAAEKLAIAAPANGLTIFQTDGIEGFWYYDAIPGEWVHLQQHIRGGIDMGPAPSTILSGSGFTLNRLAVGTDEVTFNATQGSPMHVMVSNSESEGFPIPIAEYCNPNFNSCNCHHIAVFQLFGGLPPSLSAPLISNPPNFPTDATSGCTGETDAYEYYPPGHPVYQTSGDPDLCSGVEPGASDNITFRVRGNLGTSPCGTSRFYIYIDWEQDGFFDGADDLVLNTPPTTWSGGPSTYVRPIPAAAFNGDTYMRVIVLPDPPGNSCPSGSAGETEEYQVHISCRNVPVYADVPSYCNPGDISPLSFRVSCRLLGEGPVNVRNYYFQTNDD